MFAADTQILHTFSGVPVDGDVPQGSLVRSEDKLYGMTPRGGEANEGTIFSLNKDGSGYKLLREFSGDPGDGAEPYGSLVIIGSKLYGMTSAGGDDGIGAIFSINTDGSGFEVLHSFSGNGTDGAEPYGSLLLVGSTFYGMTSAGGSGGLGTVFSIDTDGSDFETIHSFAGGAGNGSEPKGSLTHRDGVLYGMTSSGGADEVGVVFSIETDGSNFDILHEFDEDDGGLPEGSLLLYGNTLYGMTTIGGSSDDGVVFSIDTDGSDFDLLREFVGGVSDGSNPHGSFVERNGVLYGMTNNGGSVCEGVIFSLNPDGSGFSLVHSFESGSSDGANPLGTLIYDNSNFYGLTSDGGANGDGVVFSIAHSENPTPSSSGSSGSSASAPGGCGAQAPSGVPHLFQVNASPSRATLYFSPVLGADNYVVSYGFDSTASQFSVVTNLGDSSGVLSYTVNALPSSAQMYFRVQPQNGCASGNWSNVMGVSVSRVSRVYYSNP